MNISSIASASSILKFQDLKTPESSQASVDTLVSQLEKSISSGNLDTTQTILQSIKSLAPASTETSSPLSDFLKSVSTAVKDGSTSEAETAMSTYEAAIAEPPKPPVSTDAEKSAINKQLQEDKLTLNLIKMTIDPQNGTTATSNSSASTTDSNTLSTSSLTTDSYATGTLYSATA
jgi:ribosomal protein S20